MPLKMTTKHLQKTKPVAFLWLTIILMLVSACGTTRHAPAEEPQKTTRPDVDQVIEKARHVSENDKIKSTALMVEASRQKLLGNWAEATVLYHDATQADPGNDAAHYELSRIHAMAGDYHEARQYAYNATALDPANVQYQMLLADIYMLQDQSHMSIHIYEQLLGANPENMEVYYQLIATYLYNKQFEEALNQLDRMEQTFGFSEDISIQRQKIMVNLGRFEEAIHEAERLVEYMPGEAAFYELLGELYMETGQKDKAKAVYLDLLDSDPNNHMAHLLLADYYSQSGDFDNAFSHLLSAFQSPELSLDGKARIIFTYMRMADEDPGFLDQAMHLADLLLETHPGSPESYLVYADIMHMADRIEEARDMYLKGAQLDPSSIQVWQQILSLDLRLSDYESMLSHSDMALEYFFEQPILFLFNGLANMQLEDHDAAASSLEYGLSLAVDDEDLQQDFLTMLGDTYHFLEAYDLSNQFYERALRLNPSNATAMNNYAYHLAIREENLEEALQMAERAVKMDPENAAFLDTYGWVYYKLGNYREAERWISMALALPGDQTTAILEHYGDVLYKLGRKDDAVKFWKKASESGEGSDFLHKKIQDRTLYE